VRGRSLVAGLSRCDNAIVRDLARRLAIGILLLLLLALGVVAVFTHGTIKAGLAGVGVVVSLVAVVCIIVLERPPPPRRVPRAFPVAASSEDTSETYGDERAVALDLGVRWDPERPDAWFVQRDGEAALILRPEPEDADRRLVVLVWAPCTAARVGPPDAASRHEHPLYERGLRECAWAAEVRESTRIANGDRHFVILTTEQTIEVVAPDIIVHRIERIRLTASSSDEARL